MPILNPIINNKYNYELPVFSYNGDSYTASGLTAPLTVIKPNTTAPAQILDKPAQHILVKVAGMGDLVFINLEKDHLPNYAEAGLKGEYGILIRYQKKEIYFRYDLLFPYWQHGITIDEFGSLQITLDRKDQAVFVNIPEFKLPKPK